MSGLWCVFVFGDGEEASGESFRSTTGVYSRPSQLFINKILYIRLLSVGGWVGGGGTDRNRRVGRTRMGGRKH